MVPRRSFIGVFPVGRPAVVRRVYVSGQPLLEAVQLDVYKRQERTIYQGPPAKFEAGTGNIADAVGLASALDYLNRLGRPIVERYEHELLKYATGEIRSVPGLRMIGTAPEKASVLTFVLDGYRPEEVGSALDQEGIAVRAGHHCAQPILRRYGLESAVRASLALYNTYAEVDLLVAALRRLAADAGVRR